MTNFYKKILVLTLLLSVQIIHAGEGMWLPLFLESLNEKEMKSMGMKINASDIYSVNKGSLKDAVAQFGGGCTSEIISNSGLLLTNHHCGYGYIQSHSTVDNNILKNGFWAKSKLEEKPCSGLTATIISRIEDVTTRALQGVSNEMIEATRRPIIEKNIKAIAAEIKKENYEDVFVRAFYNGNQYFAFVTITYRDIRLVGTPPESIGKFGSDTDNWVWPRHTGDFSLFRIYVGADNLPAAYSESNKPLTPKHYLPISMSGVSDGDFTMVFGFPGRTNEYLTREGVKQIVEVQNPIRIKMRDNALGIMDKYMRTDEAIKIQYAPTYAGIANAWKKWIGENQGIKTTKGLDRKNANDIEFQKRVDANPKFEAYRKLNHELEYNYRASENLTAAKEYYAEAFQRNIQLYNFYSIIKKLISTLDNKGENDFEKLRKEYLIDAEGYYRNYNTKIDREIFASLLEIFHQGCKAELMSTKFLKKMDTSNTNYLKFANDIYTNTYMTTPDRMKMLLTMNSKEMRNALNQDEVWLFYEDMNNYVSEYIVKKSQRYDDALIDLRRQYMAALMDVFPERRFYPDANSTLRVSYGQVEGFMPRDGACYQSQTYLDGVMEKYVPGDYEFDVPEKLISLYKKKDYGIYAENGKMPLAFIASNHTTGGNSGSPAIDANGNLIGLNFDRVWEGTMSDINYDRSICRNIMVDARYILFIIDKFGDAAYLVNEMKLVYPKQSSKKKKK